MDSGSGSDATLELREEKEHYSIVTSSSSLPSNKSKRRSNKSSNNPSSDHIYSLYFLHDLQPEPGLLATTSADRTIKLWDIYSESSTNNHYKHIQTLTAHTGSVLSLTYLKQCIISCSTDQTIRIWTINTTT